MLQLGKFNTLCARRTAPAGMVLREIDGEEEVVLPKRHLPIDLKIGGTIDVFLYTDSDDRITATTVTPKILLHQFSVLEVKDVNRFGAFLDWGLDKDLFLPFAEQREIVKKGDKVTVCLFLDDLSDRLVASAKVKEFIDRDISFEKGQEVQLIIDRQTDLGFQAIINNHYFGLIFSSNVFQPLRKGDHLRGYIHQVREDGKVDLTLQKPGYGQVAESQDVVLQALQENDGVLFLTDKSDPKLITAKLQISKKVFKKCVGALYKQRKIKIETDRIVLC